MLKVVNRLVNRQVNSEVNRPFCMNKVRRGGEVAEESTVQCIPVLSPYF